MHLPVGIRARRSIHRLELSTQHGCCGSRLVLPGLLLLLLYLLMLLLLLLLLKLLWGELMLLMVVRFLLLEGMAAGACRGNPHQ